MVCVPSEFIAAMRRYPASVSIIATGRPGHRFGMTVSAVCSLTAEPPQLLVNMNLTAGTTASVREVGWFSVNVLRENQSPLANRFASRDPSIRGEARFAEGHWQQSDEGVPYLVDAAKSFICRNAAQFETSTHLIMVSAVERLFLPSPEPVLMYHNGTYGHFSSADPSGIVGR